MAKKPVVPKTAKAVGEKKTLPKSIDWGPDVPRDHLAYLNKREMDYIQQLRGFKGKREYNGVPAFPDPGDTKKGDTGRGTSSSSGLGGGGKGGGRGSSGGSSRGTGGSAGSRSSGSSSGGQGGQGGFRGAGGNYGPGSNRPGSDPRASGQSSGMRGAGGNYGPGSGRGTGGFGADRRDQQKSITNAARSATQSDALKNDLRAGGINSIRVGPMSAPVSVGRPYTAPGSGTISRSISQSGKVDKESPFETGFGGRVSATPAVSPGSVPVPKMNPLSDPTKFKLKSPNILQGVNPVALSKLARLQEEYGQPLTITSGFRDPELNKKVKGAKKSQHIHGNAIDISIPGASAAETANLIKKASEVGFGGIGGYRPGKIHVDVASQRAWGPDYTGITIGGRIGDVLKAHTAGKIKEIGPNYAEMERNPSVRAASSVQTATRPTDVSSVPSAPASQPSSVPSALDGIMSAYNTAKSYYDAAPSLKDISQGYSDLQKQLSDYQKAKTGLFSSVTGPIADKRMKDAITSATSQGIAGLKNFINAAIGTSVIGRAQAATPTGPIMSGNQPAQKAVAEDQEKILKVETVPAETPTIPGPNRVMKPLNSIAKKAIADRVVTINGESQNLTPEQFSQLSPEDQVKIAAELQKVRYSAPQPTPEAPEVPSDNESLTVEADPEKPQYGYSKNPMQDDWGDIQRPKSNVEKHAGWTPFGIGAGVRLGGWVVDKQWADMSPEERLALQDKWNKSRDQYVRNQGPVNDRGPNIPTQLGSSGSYDTASSQTPTNTGNGGIPTQYYYWNLGMNIPSPGDSDYTLYIKYLHERAADQAAV